MSADEASLIQDVDDCHERAAALGALRALMLPDDDLAGVPKAGFYALLGLINGR